MKIVSLLCALLVFTGGFSVSAFAQPETQRVNRLEGRVTSLEQKIAKIGGDQAPALFLFGAFCALWAQNTGRSGWLWFFLGFVFSFIAVLVVLAKNSNDVDRRRAAAARAARAT